MQEVHISRRRWLAVQAEHVLRADELTAGRRARRGTGAKHPVEDFLFEYYNFTPGKLRRWHPGAGVVLEDAGGEERARWPGYLTRADGGVLLDVHGLVARRGEAMGFVRSLLQATLDRPAFTGCFGLHEWAMVYRLAPEEIRHAAYPLRLSPSETNDVVESHTIRCSHFDAFRFFTPEALSRNTIQPTRGEQVTNEQPGCLHAGMDVYKWAHKLSPLTPSELTLDAFELAREIRILDMRASPYDLSALGLAPVEIETAAGKLTYASAQRVFAERSNALRERLLESITRAESAL